MDSPDLEGPVQLASSNLVTDAVIAATLDRLRSEYSDLVPYISQASEGAVVGDLLQGQLDVAFTTAPLADPNRSRVEVGEVGGGVYCGTDHPLASATGSTAESLAPYSFVLWGLRPDGSTSDGWPASLPRVIGTVVHRPLLALDIAVRGHQLVVLPDAIVTRSPHATGLVKIPTQLVQPTPVFAHHRHSLLPYGRAETVVEMARSAVSGGL